MEAIEEIQDASIRFLKASIDFNGKTSSQYHRDFDKVQEALLDIENLAKRQAHMCSQKINELEGEIQELKELLASSGDYL